MIGVITHIPPPTIDGDPLVLCSVTFELPEDVDPQELAARLDEELIDPDGNAEWFEPADDLLDGPDGRGGAAAAASCSTRTSCWCGPGPRCGPSG